MDSDTAYYMQALTKLFCNHSGCRSYGSSSATTFIYQGMKSTYLSKTFSVKLSACFKLNF